MIIDSQSSFHLNTLCLSSKQAVSRKSKSAYTRFASLGDDNWDARKKSGTKKESSLFSV